MKKLIGSFFCVTKWSMYQITIPCNLASRPTVKKWATHTTSEELGRDLHVPVGGTFQNGFHIAITNRGLFQYNIPPEHKGSPLPFEQVPPRFRATRITQTTLIAGLFMEWRHAEECFEMMTQKPKESFLPLWHGDTKAVLTKIEMDHPLVVISNTPGKFAVPQYLWDPEMEIPFIEK